MILDSGINKEREWLQKLNLGLKKSSRNITLSLNKLFSKGSIDQSTLDELEDILITADLGVAAASKITEKLKSASYGQQINFREAQNLIINEIENIFEPIAKPLTFDASHLPHVSLVCGVNGSGKTTTVGKLAHLLVKEGKSVLLAAGDTFRAGAIEQLTIWGNRAKCTVVSNEQSIDAASVVFDAFQKARNDKNDVLLVDTAGRLQNKTELMEELNKITRVLKRIDPEAPHSCILVLDATVGQNAHSQVKVFSDTVNLTGLIITKLDGSAKGGILISLAQEHQLPVYAIGIGEKIDDLQEFNPIEFAKSLINLDGQ